MGTKTGDDNIPEWLLWEVLVRVPCSKYVVRCKAVSKQWASLISNPSFVRSYISRHHSPLSSSWIVIGPRITTTTNHNRRLTFLEYDFPPDYDNKQQQQQHFGSLRQLPPPPQTDAGSFRYEVFGTSNGLILFGLCSSDSIVMDIYYLCNPVTGELISIPPSGLGLLRAPGHNWGPGLVTHVADDAVLKSFRVVLLLTDDKQGEYLRFVVYASETMNWEEFVVPIGIRYGSLSTIPVTLNNQIVHWLTTEDGSVIAYDPYHHPDRIRVIAPPPAEEDDDLTHWNYSVSVVGGKLSYFERHRNGSVEFKLWVLEDYSWWRLSHEASVQLKENDSLYPKFFDGDVLFLASKHGLVSYEFKTGKVREYTDDDGSLRSGKKLGPSSLAFLVQASPWPVSIKEIPSHPLCASSPETPPKGNIVNGSSCKNFLDYFLSDFHDNRITLLAACCAFVLFHS